MGSRSYFERERAVAGTGTAQSLSTIAIAAEQETLQAAAQSLARELRLPWVERTHRGHPILLVLTEKRLELRETGPNAVGPVYVDFIGGRMGHRRRFGGGRSESLARAVGLKGAATLTVVDATAGLGRDAFVLASLGCSVKLFERSPVIAALLHDGLNRALADPEVEKIAARLELLSGDAVAILENWTDPHRPDVVYLDPMYPQRSKSTLVKKEMKLYRTLVGADADAPALLGAALICAGRRVVVKRARLAPAIEGPSPTMQITGRSTRFDVYVIKAFHGRG